MFSLLVKSDVSLLHSTTMQLLTDGLGKGGAGNKTLFHGALDAALRQEAISSLDNLI